MGDFCFLVMLWQNEATKVLGIKRDKMSDFFKFWLNVEKKLSITLILMLITSIANANNNSIISVKLISENKVQICYSLPKKEMFRSIMLYRSHVNLVPLETLDIYSYPISKYSLDPQYSSGKYLDSTVASGVTYYYYLLAYNQDGLNYGCNVDSIFIPGFMIAATADSSFNIFIDKFNYVLEARNGKKLLKRYPISLGENPFSRKLHQDNLTTPEGAYKVVYIKESSKYYKAIGLNYPNSVDSLRYSEAKRNNLIPSSNGKTLSIGSAIQIHGGGISANWTFGCIAMRDSDIDELLSIKKNLLMTPIYIVGEELKTIDDCISSLNMMIPDTN